MPGDRSVAPALADHMLDLMRKTKSPRPPARSGRHAAKRAMAIGEQRLTSPGCFEADQSERLAERRPAPPGHRPRSRASGAQEAPAPSRLFFTPARPVGTGSSRPLRLLLEPREARTAGWRPYTDGTGLTTTLDGKANEPFGWATYHYGRWARIKRLGWVWVPGSEWAPAWVAWRRSDQYVGWAPLPPEAHSGTGFNAGVDSYYDIGPASYNFVPAASFGEPTYRGIVVEPERNVTIVKQTVNVTKINYTTVETKPSSSTAARN